MSLKFDKMINEEKDLMILDLIILSFGNELLLRYGTIGYYIESYPNVTENSICNRINAYLNNEIEFRIKVLQNIKMLSTKDEQIYILSSAESFINISSRSIDFIGDKNKVTYAFTKLLNEIDIEILSGQFKNYNI
jgi:hypothetical protein